MVRDLLVVVLVMGTMVLVGLIVLAFVIWRKIHRSWTALRTHGLVVAASSLAGSKAPRHPLHQELWREVNGAHAALTTAMQHQVPLADLPLLGQQLERAAVRLDPTLRTDANPSTETVRQVADLVASAREIRSAAERSLSEVNRQEIDDLRWATAREALALDAGLATMRPSGSEFLFDRSHEDVQTLPE